MLHDDDDDDDDNNKHCLKKYLPICDEMTEDSDYVDKVITKMDPAALI